MKISELFIESKEILKRLCNKIYDRGFDNNILDLTGFAMFTVGSTTTYFSDLNVAGYFGKAATALVAVLGIAMMIIDPYKYPFKESDTTLDRPRSTKEESNSKRPQHSVRTHDDNGSCGPRA